MQTHASLFIFTNVVNNFGHIYIYIYSIFINLLQKLFVKLFLKLNSWNELQTNFVLAWFFLNDVTPVCYFALNIYWGFYNDHRLSVSSGGKCMAEIISDVGVVHFI